MSSMTLSSRLPWTDRWSKPSRDQLLAPLAENHRRAFKKLIDRLEAFDDLECDIVWFGPSWKWTLQYTFAPPTPAKTARPQEPQTMCYLVPATTGPLLCVPMTQGLIRKLPVHRFRKYVKDGITLAKCAVEIFWATWTAQNETETQLLIDLLKRKHDLTLRER